MLSKTAAVAILAFTSSVLALPNFAPLEVTEHDGVTGAAEQGIIYPTAAKAVGGAIDIADKFATSSAPAPTTTAAPSLAARADHEAKLDARAPAFYTISIINKFGRDILTAHNKNWNAPDPVRGNLAPGVLRNGASDYIAVPPGWAGNIPVVENGGGRQIVGDESKIEASFVGQGGPDPVFDVNISYVDGFSLPITCYCDVGVVAGCNKYLWDFNRCADDNWVGSCRNPMRADGWSSIPFFEPCQHAAYTYAHDDSANTGNGVCNGDTITCCVGTDCPRNPRQS